MGEWFLIVGMLRFRAPHYIFSFLTTKLVQQMKYEVFPKKISDVGIGLLVSGTTLVPWETSLVLGREGY